jgi:hypothetical protein
MVKRVIGLLTLLFIAGSSPGYAQDSSSPIPSQTNFNILTDARIGVLKAVLQLTPEQAKYWPAVEEAIRAKAEVKYQRIVAVAKQFSQQHEVDPVALIRERADALTQKAAALKKLADAWEALSQKLNPDQKERLRLLAMRVLSQHMEPHPMEMFGETEDAEE